MDGIEEILGSEAEQLLTYRCTGIDASQLQLPGEDFIDRVLSMSDRSNPN